LGEERLKQIFFSLFFLGLEKNKEIAVIFYNMLKNKTAYISQSQEEYDPAHKQRVLKQLQQKAVQFSLELVPLT